MHYDALGDPRRPPLVCIPGLLGGPENFLAMIPSWTEHFRVLVLDPHRVRREAGLTGLREESIREVSYDTTSGEIAEILRKEGIDRAFLTGVSLGGKVVYDFAAKYPEFFRGGVITDVGPGSFSRSELFLFVDGIVQNLNRHLPWTELKAELQSRIEDRSLRSLIQSQLFYPVRDQLPAEWKVGMRNFRSMLQRQGIDEQFEDLAKVDTRLAEQGHLFHVLHASRFSGISEDSLPRLRKLKAIQIEEVPASTHFLHITHKDLIVRTVLKLLS